MGEIDNIVLHAGDMLYDTVTGDLAFLVCRTVSVSHRWTYNPQLPDADGTFRMYVWKMYWIPPDWCTYTESSLIGMLRSGRFVLYKGNMLK